MNITLNIYNTLGYSFINGRLKVFVNKGTVSESQESNTSDTQATEQSQNTNSITYYAYPPDENNIFTKVVNSLPEDKSYTAKIVTLDNKVGKLGINLTNRALSSPNRYIEPFCDVTNSGQFKDKSPTSIKLISEGEVKFENGNWILVKNATVEYS